MTKSTAARSSQSTPANSLSIVRPSAAWPNSPLPRYRRAEGELPGLLLQERDLALIEDVWRFGLLTTSQLELLRSCDAREELRFVSRLPLTRRLKLLFHHGYLRRLARPQTQGSLEPVYLLDREGARALRQRHAEVDEDHISGQKGGKSRGTKARSPSQVPKPSALEHRLGISRFRVALTAACHLTAKAQLAPNVQPAAKVQLGTWHSGDQVAFPVTLEKKGERTRTVTLIPDGFFVLRVNGLRLFYFLEVDRSSEPVGTLVDKCAAYASYWREGGFSRAFNVPVQVGFRVLFTVPSCKRADSLLTAVSALEAGKRLFWVTEDENITPERVLEPVFRCVHVPDRYSLMGGTV